MPVDDETAPETTEPSDPEESTSPPEEATPAGEGETAPASPVMRADQTEESVDGDLTQPGLPPTDPEAPRVAVTAEAAAGSTFEAPPPEATATRPVDEASPDREGGADGEGDPGSPGTGRLPRPTKRLALVSGVLALWAGAFVGGNYLGQRIDDSNADREDQPSASDDSRSRDDDRETTTTTSPDRGPGSGDSPGTTVDDGDPGGRGSGVPDDDGDDDDDGDEVPATTEPTTTTTTAPTTTTTAPPPTTTTTAPPPTTTTTEDPGSET